MFKGKLKYLADHLSSGFESVDEEFWRKEPKWQVRSKLSWNVQPDLNSARPIIPGVEVIGVRVYRQQWEISGTAVLFPEQGFPPGRVWRSTYRLEPKDITITIEETQNWLSYQQPTTCQFTDGFSDFANFHPSHFSDDLISVLNIYI